MSNEIKLTTNQQNGFFALNRDKDTYNSKNELTQ